MRPNNKKGVGWLPRLFTLLSLVGVLAIVAAACGDDDDDDDSDSATTEEEATSDEPDTEATEPEDGGEGEEPTPGDDEAAADERQDGGSITIHGHEFASLDPHFSSFAQDISTQRLLWRGLYSLSLENEVIAEANGVAAALPEASEDGLTYTVALNEGLTWSDGDDLKAEDYVAGILRTCNPVNAGEYQVLLSNIVGCDDYYYAGGTPDAPGDPATTDLQALQDAVGVTALDDLTIEFTLNSPQPTFPTILTLWLTFPVPVHLDRFANATPEAPGDWGTDPAELVYNGPYVLTNYTQADNVVIEPNPNWSGEIKPTLDEITIRFIDDSAIADNAYRTGELQFALVDTSQLSVIPDEFGDEYLKVVVPVTRGLQMQLDNETLADLNVRLALSKAIDRETMNEVVVQGAHLPTTSWIPENVSGTPAGTYDELLGFDPEGAQAALAEAGFPDGEGFPVLSILVGDNAAARAAAEFLQQNFQEILNIEVEIEVVDAATRSSRYTAEDFELFLGGWAQDYPDPENWLPAQFRTDGSLNNYNCSNSDLDALLDAAEFNTNNEERLEQYREAEGVLLEDVCGIAPYWHENTHYLIKPDLCGFKEFVSSQDAFSASDWHAEGWGLCAE